MTELNSKQPAVQRHELCLTLLCPTAVEEKLLDFLLMSAQVQLFTSTQTAAHGANATDFNPAEQVQGRIVMTQVQVLLAEPDQQDLLNDIQQQFTGTGIRYWVTSVIAVGEIT